MRCQRFAKSSAMAICGFGILCLIAAETAAQPSSGRTGPIMPAPNDASLTEDLVRFTNRDVLSGPVEEIVNGALTMTPAMAEAPLTIPVDAVKEMVFSDTEENRSGADRLVLANTESLSGTIDGMTDGNVTFTLPSSQTVVLDRASVAAMAFHKDEEVLLEESFDSGLPETARWKGGLWRTQNGRLLQTDSKAVECLASFPVTQTGELVYEWTVDTSMGRSTTIYFMASGPGLSQRRGYSLRIMRRYVYIFLCLEGEEVFCGSYGISLSRNRNRVQLRCDSHRGRIELRIDGMEAGRWDSSVPITLGKYVVLRADGRAAFDDLKVTQKAGAACVEPKPANPGGDVLTLVNGDEIAGTVAAVSATSVSFTSGNRKPSRIGKEKLLCVRFAGELKPLPQAVKGVVVFFMRNGDRISGELLSVKGETATIRSELAGVLELRRDNVQKVLFREFP